MHIVHTAFQTTMLCPDITSNRSLEAEQAAQPVFCIVPDDWVRTISSRTYMRLMKAKSFILHLLLLRIPFSNIWKEYKGLSSNTSPAQVGGSV